MKRILVSFFLNFLLCGMTFSQTDDSKRAAFQFSFMPFMSTNGLQAKEYTNKVSINLLSGLSKNEKAFAFAGLLNIAESSDWPVALVNIIKNGDLGIAATYNEIGSMVVALRSGGRHTYGIVGIGYNHKVNRYVTAGGLGAHIHVTRWLTLNNELVGETLNNFSKYITFKVGYAFLPAFRLTPHIELFGGPSINYIQTDDLRNVDMIPDKHIWRKFGDTKFQQVYFGYQAGLQYFF